jgi:hypothetical protein
MVSKRRVKNNNERLLPLNSQPRRPAGLFPCAPVLIAASVASRFAWAKAYPARPERIIVGFAAVI